MIFPISQNLILEGTHVKLLPLSFAHLNALCEIGLDENLWKLGTKQIKTRNDMLEYIQEAVSLRDKSEAFPFAAIEKSSGKIIGSTRYGNIDLKNKRLEIGWTWIAQPWQRTPINTEAKYLMLQYGFEVLRLIRVEFKTDLLNERSKNAIRRIGAKEEGIFRQHIITENGRIRDTIYYSIIDKEWPEIKISFEEKLLAKKTAENF
jgi:N-acetyltransferase